MGPLGAATGLFLKINSGRPDRLTPGVLRCYVPAMNRGIIGTIVGVLVVIILVLVIMRLA